MVSMVDLDRMSLFMGFKMLAQVMFEHILFRLVPIGLRWMARGMMLGHPPMDGSILYKQTLSGGLGA